MTLLVRSAPPPLNSFIATVWYWQSDAQGSGQDAIMASSHTSILINLAQDRLRSLRGDRYSELHETRGIAVVGPSTRSFLIDSHHTHVMGVQFRTGGVFPFLRLPLRHLADRQVSLEDIWGSDAERLHQELVRARLPAQKFDILFRSLLKRARGYLEQDPAVSLAIRRIERPPHRVRISLIAKDAGLSRRALIERVSAQIGLSPKLYLRLERFQNALGRIAAGGPVAWSDVAFRSGYFDQSHFIHEFREFSGLTPSHYRARRGLYAQHVRHTA